MEKYNYHQEVKNDILQYLKDNDIRPEEGEDRNDFEDRLNDELFCVDAITGNGSGSYTFSAWQAEENLCHNLDLLGEALEEFGCESNYILEKGAEACDVTIRCYLLGNAISEALDEIWDEIAPIDSENEVEDEQ